MPATIERAFELAGSGTCRTLQELRLQLRREGCEFVEFHLAGRLTKTQLTELMTRAGPEAARAAPPDRA